MTAMTEEARRQYVTVTGAGLNIRGWQEMTMVIGEINVQLPVIGLPGMDFNDISMHTSNELYIEQYGYNEQVIRIRSHLRIAAMVLPGLHNHKEVRVASSIHTRYAATSQSQLIIGEVEDLSNQTYVPRHLRQPQQATAMEVAVHRLTHMLYEGQPNHHRIKGGAQGAIIDPSGLCLHQVNDGRRRSIRRFTVLTGVETITGLCMPIPTTKKGATQYQPTQSKKFVMENGLEVCKQSLKPDGLAIALDVGCTYCGGSRLGGDTIGSKSSTGSSNCSLLSPDCTSGAWTRTGAFSANSGFGVARDPMQSPTAQCRELTAF
eukprot:5599240-Amphidinium_carterae.1